MVLHQVGATGDGDGHHFLRFLVVLAAALKAAAVGAPLVPGLRIFSPEPAAIRLRLARIASYKPGSPGFLRGMVATFTYKSLRLDRR